MNVRYIRITDVNYDGKLRNDDPVYLSHKIAKPYMLRHSDLLLARSGATVGKVFYYDGIDEGACFAGYLIRAQVNRSIAEPRFVYYALNSGLYWAYVNSRFSKATIQNLNAELYGSVPVPFPDRHEQRLIADFLDRETVKADALVVQYERLIELLEEKRVALITQAVTKGLDPNVPMKGSGIPYLREIPRHWGMPALGYIAEVVLGKMRAAEPSDPNDVLVPYLKARNVTPDKLDFDTFDNMWCSTAELTDLRVRPGDIIVCEGGVTFGRSAIASSICPENVIFEKSLHRIRTSQKIDAQYLNYLLCTLRSSTFLTTIAATATFMHLTREKLVAMRFPLPPIEEQRQILHIIERENADSGTIMSGARAAVALVKERRASLITAAVTGQIDIKTYHSKQERIAVSA